MTSGLTGLFSFNASSWHHRSFWKVLEAFKTPPPHPPPATHTHTRAHTRTHTRTYTHARALTHRHTRTHAHARTHTHTHTLLIPVWVIIGATFVLCIYFYRSAQSMLPILCLCSNFGKTVHPSELNVYFKRAKTKSCSLIILVLQDRAW